MHQGDEKYAFVAQIINWEVIMRAVSIKTGIFCVNRIAFE